MGRGDGWVPRGCRSVGLTADVLRWSCPTGGWLVPFLLRMFNVNPESEPLVPAEGRAAPQQHRAPSSPGPCGVLDGASCPSRPCWALTSSAWSLVPEPHLPDPDRPGKPTLPETASPCSPAWPRARALFLLMVGSGRWTSRLPSTHSSAQTTGPVSEPPRLPLCTCWYPPSQHPVGHYVWIRSRFSSSVWD